MSQNKILEINLISFYHKISILFEFRRHFKPLIDSLIDTMVNFFSTYSTDLNIFMSFTVWNVFFFIDDIETQSVANAFIEAKPSKVVK